MQGKATQRLTVARSWPSLNPTPPTAQPADAAHGRERERCGACLAENPGPGRRRMSLELPRVLKFQLTMNVRLIWTRSFLSVPLAVESCVVWVDATAVAIDELHPGLVTATVLSADDLGLGRGCRNDNAKLGTSFQFPPIASGWC
jgi:hypothetical protein